MATYKAQDSPESSSRHPPAPHRARLLSEFASLLAATVREVQLAAIQMRADRESGRQDRWDGELAKGEAARIERQWHLFDPTVKAAILDWAEEAGISYRQAKRRSLEEAFCEVWTGESLAAFLAHRDRLVKRRAENSLKSTSPIGYTVPLMEELFALEPADGLAAALKPDQKKALDLRPLSKAERAWAEHYLAWPELSPDERDQELGKKSGFSRQMLRRLKRRLAG